MRVFPTWGSSMFCLKAWYTFSKVRWSPSMWANLNISWVYKFVFVFVFVHLNFESSLAFLASLGLTKHWGTESIAVTERISLLRASKCRLLGMISKQTLVHYHQMQQPTCSCIRRMLWASWPAEGPGGTLPWWLPALGRGSALQVIGWFRRFRRFTCEVAVIIERRQVVEKFESPHQGLRCRGVHEVEVDLGEL